MNHCIFIGIQCLLTSMSFGATSSNSRTAGKVSSSKIIFLNDDHEPLLPRPTFSPNVKPRFRTGPPKKFTPVSKLPPLAERKRPVITTTITTTAPTNLSPTTPPPKSIYKSPRKTTATTSTNIPITNSPSTILKPSGSNPSKSVLVEPILEGSFYVPFKMMKMDNGTRPRPI